MLDRVKYKGRMAALAGGAVALAVAAAVGLAVPSGPARAQAGPPGGAKRAVAVEAGPVEVRAVEDEVKAVGSLRANESVTIRPEIAGRVTELPFQEGAKVEKGAVLVRLDPTAARAELAQADSALNLSQRNYARVLELLQKNAATPRARDEAQAKLDSDRATVDLSRTRLAKTEILAPFSGTIGLRQVSVGAYVSPGQDIVDLVGADPIKVDFSIPERFLSKVRAGQRLDIDVDAFPGERFSGEVYALAPQIDPQGRSLALRARIANPDGKLRPGLFARVRLVIATRASAVLIPEQAVFAQGGGWFVFRVVEGTAKLAKIETGVRRAGWVEIASGLAPGDVVVKAGALKLRDGTPVQVLGQDKKPAAKP